MKKREELVRKALLDKVGANFEMFTASDILVAAGISEKDFKKWENKLDNETKALIEKAVPYEL